MRPQAADFAIGLLTAGWRSAVSTELAGALNDQLWGELAARRGSRALCRDLAYIARELDKIVEYPKLFLKWAVRRAVRSQGRSEFEQELAGSLVSHLISDSIKLEIRHVADLARVLRLVGIWSCLQANLSLGGCECFEDLVSDKSKELIRAQIEARIDGYLASRLS